MNGTEKLLIAALIAAEIIAVAPLIYIVKLSGPELGGIAQVAVTTIGTITLAVVGAITLALRKRATRSRR
ncbi:hypothetical protein [Micromonospora sp. NPDC049107]|uniref:hypothetical protein n=1 Tax=Micromonospora sp. NPDC049107 TaxID=3154349 RepID=UPI0033FA5387